MVIPENNAWTMSDRQLDQQAKQDILKFIDDKILELQNEPATLTAQNYLEALERQKNRINKMFYPPVKVDRRK